MDVKEQYACTKVMPLSVEVSSYSYKMKGMRKIQMPKQVFKGCDVSQSASGQVLNILAGCKSDSAKTKM